MNNERKPTEVLEKLYLGGIFDASRKDTLLKLGIKYILIVGNNMEPIFPNDFVYKTIEIEDEPDVNIEMYFEQAYNFIKEGITNGGCFVHCAFGASRSVSIIISYLMKENSWKFNEAYEFIKKKRKVTSPNPGFVLQLRFYEVTLGLRTKEELEKDLEENKYVRNMKYL